MISFPCLIFLIQRDSDHAKPPPPPIIKWLIPRGTTTSLGYYRIAVIQEFTFLFHPFLIIMSFTAWNFVSDFPEFWSSILTYFKRANLQTAFVTPYVVPWSGSTGASAGESWRWKWVLQRKICTFRSCVSVLDAFSGAIGVNSAHTR